MIIIRQETEKDFKNTEQVIEETFRDEEFTDHSEHILVAKLSQSDAYVPELSLVAEKDGQIIGHVMLSELKISGHENQYRSLALAPVSVLPDFQNQGVGSKLIEESLKIAGEMGYESAVVLGHSEYYPKFGFKPAIQFGIQAPFEVSPEYFMALELQEGSLEDIEGTVIYSSAFSE